ncbi:hypothetical protein ACNFCJ_18890 [Pseudomonas sp. NY15364]
MSETLLLQIALIKAVSEDEAEQKNTRRSADQTLSGHQLKARSQAGAAA